MRRLSSYTRNALIVLSLLVCAATSVFWVRSYWLLEKWTLSHSDSALTIGTMRGSIIFVWVRSPNLGNFDQPLDDITPRDADQLNSRWHWHGFRSDIIRAPYVPFTAGYAVIPCWSLVFLGGLLPFVGVLAHHFLPKKLAGMCVTCGYDLRATPDRCPECGTIPNDLK